MNDEINWVIDVQAFAARTHAPAMPRDDVFYISEVP
jgi:hypothetical protein